MVCFSLCLFIILIVGCDFGVLCTVYLVCYCGLAVVYYANSVVCVVCWSVR